MNVTIILESSHIQSSIYLFFKGKCWFLTSLTIAVFLGLMLAGYNYYWKDVISIRVMSYNTWGMPGILAQDKEERMKRFGIAYHKSISHSLLTTLTISQFFLNVFQYFYAIFVSFLKFSFVGLEKCSLMEIMTLFCWKSSGLGMTIQQ